MIAHAKTYTYDRLGGSNAYGIPELQRNAGSVSMAVYLRGQSKTDNPLYSMAQYVGYTFDTVTDDMVINVDGKPLKVIYVQPSASRWNIVYLYEAIS